MSRLTELAEQYIVSRHSYLEHELRLQELQSQSYWNAIGRGITAQVIPERQRAFVDWVLADTARIDLYAQSGMARQMLVDEFNYYTVDEGL